MSLEHHLVKTNGVRLHVVEAGPEDGEIVIMLHGYPGFWRCWEAQIEFLARQGWRVWAPDQRGYNLSSKPRGVAAYNLDELVDDLIGLVDASGQEQVFLVAHDWGAGVAWRAARMFPERFKKMVILNGPHGSVMRKHVARSPAQLLKSWYMFFFQLPLLPEWMLRANNWEGLVRGMKTSSRPGTFDEERLAAYREAWSQPGANRAMLNWYRAAVRERPSRKAPKVVQVPTLLIWGTEDAFLGRELAELSIEMCEKGRVVFIEGATHWVQHEAAEQVNKLIDNFFN